MSKPNYLLTEEDLSLFTSCSRFQLATVFLKDGMEKDVATFDLFVREMPSARNYLIFAGLERVLEFLKNLRLTLEQLKWLKKTGISEEGLKYFKDFKFTGEVWAMPEGTIFFANEPIMRITAPMIEAQFIEWFLINVVFVETILASKFSRFIEAANGKEVVFGYNRSYGPDTAMRAARIDQIFGISTSLAAYFFKNNKTPFSAGSFHYLIMSYENEIDAFRSYLRHCKGKGYALVDTYNTEKGIKNYIQAAKEIEKELGIKVTGIQLDSGDLLSLSKLARSMFDGAGLKHAKIFAMGNLDEYRVDRLEKYKAPIDIYAGTTEVMTPKDAPTIELVYKMNEIMKNGESYPKMKLTSSKISLPGRKQVIRVENNGKYAKDMIALENEKAEGKKLLVQMVKKGKLVYKIPELSKIGDYYREEKKKFPKEMFSVTEKYDYKVEISKGLNDLSEKTKEEIIKIHHDSDEEGV